MSGCSPKDQPMAAYAVQIEGVPAGSNLVQGTVVALFEDRESAEYFRTVAWNLRSLRGCSLAAAVYPTMDRPHVKVQAA